MFASLGGIASLNRYVCLDTEHHPALVGVQFHRQENSLFVSFTKPTGFEKWNRGAAIFTCHCACPEISNRLLRYPPRVAFIKKIILAEFCVEHLNIRSTVILRWD